jgi:hypothetical protein
VDVSNARGPKRMQRCLGTTMPRARTRFALVVAAAALIVAVLAPAAPAALAPGVPVVPAPGVPGNGRAWELVTPPEFDLFSIGAINGVSANGDRMVFRTLGPLAGAQGTSLLPATFAIRGPGGWNTASVTPPDSTRLLPQGPTKPVAFNPAMTSAIWLGEIPLSGGEGQLALYRRNDADQFSLISELGDGSSLNDFLGASSDLGRVFFVSAKHLLPGDAGRTAGKSLYEASGSGLHLVDVAGNGSLLSDCGVKTWGVNGSRDGMDISEDGRRVYFVTQPCEGGGGTSRVYLREDGGTAKEISATQCTGPGCGLPQDADFLGATPDGASAFIFSTERLTNEDADEGPDLYRYDVGSGNLTLVTTTGPTASPVPVRPSLNGSRVFFCSGDEVDRELVVADEHGIRPLPSPPAAEPCGALLASPGNVGIQWSANGRYALLTTEGSLSAGDTDTTWDVYRYDGVSGDFSDLSLGENGAGNGPFEVRLAEVPNGFGASFYLSSRAMSDSGKEVFFSTVEALLPQDRNAVGDVYEWANGSLSLVSDGVGASTATLLGASPDGSTVFFKTAATLLPRDRDGGASDIYAAVVGGGFPEPAPPSECLSACGPADGGRLSSPTPASAEALRGGIRLRPLDAAARRRIVASGLLTVLAEVPQAGNLSASAKARVGRKLKTIAAASEKVGQPGPVRLSMQLSKEARRRLAAGKDLRVELALKLASLPGRERASFKLEASR